MLPENAPVRLTSAQLEELDYEKLYCAYSARGRKSKVDPRVMFKVMVYGYQCGIYSSRKLEEACRYRIDFKWLLEDEKEPDHSTFARFRTGRCGEAVEELFYQYVKLLEKQGETDHETVFVDGTKLESCAGRYTFCWRGSVEKHLEQVRAKVFSLTGMKKRQSLNEYLSQQREQIEFVHGKGKHKSKEQRRWEELDALCKRWEEYENSLKVMGNTRNSYSKTDPDATFMRMKDDHMRNGHLKQLQRRHETRYKEVTADAGYESLENYLYLEENEQLSFIKPANYEAQKTKKFKRQIGRIENMTYDLQEDYFTCAEGRRLLLSRETTELLNGHFVTTAHYRCENCKDCPRRTVCCQAKDPEQAKEVTLKKTFWEKRAQSQANIMTERGIYLRMCRSIQVEGAFALLKTDFGFRRFLTKGKKNVRTELFFLAMAFNLKKLWMKRENGRLKTHLSEIRFA